MKRFDCGFKSTTDMKETEIDLFKDLETRLKLRALLVRKKAEQFAKPIPILEKDDRLALEKMKEKTKILKRLKQIEGSDYYKNE